MRGPPFPDLRASCAPRREGDIADRRHPSGPPPRGGGDPPPRRRGRRSRSALHEGSRLGLSAGHEPLRHASARRDGLRNAAPSPRATPGRAGPDPPAAEPREALGSARRGPGGVAGGPSAAPVRTRPRRRDRRRAPGPPSRRDVLAGGRRPVPHPAARLHRASREPAATTSACTGVQVHDATRPECTGRSARAGGFHYAVAEAARRGAAGQRLPGRTAGARSSPRWRRFPRTCPSCCWRRWWLGGDSPWRTTRPAHSPSPPTRSSRWSAKCPRASARRRARSATTTATTRSGTTIRSSTADACSTAGSRSSRPPWWESRGRRTSSSATSCRSCSLRCSRW